MSNPTDPPTAERIAEIRQAWTEYGNFSSRYVDELLVYLDAQAAQIAALRLELEGDGTHGPDARTSLGLRACIELASDNAALLTQQISALTARAERAEAALDKVRALVEK